MSNNINHFSKLGLILLISIALQAKIFAQITPDHIDLARQYSLDIRNKTPAVIKKENIDNYNKFVAMDLDSANLVRDEKNPKYLNPKDGENAVSVAMLNPIVGFANYEKYDPANEGIGYCFGRAMFIHLFLASKGFDRDSIKKAFILGDMETPDGNTWGWHVTTIAQSIHPVTKKEQWLALDPIVGKVMSVEKWYEEMLTSYSTDQKLKLYITNSGRFALSETYDHDSISSKFYHNYFNDMMNWFETNFYAQGYARTSLKDYKN